MLYHRVCILDRCTQKHVPSCVRNQMKSLQNSWGLSVMSSGLVLELLQKLTISAILYPSSFIEYLFTIEWKCIHRLIFIIDVNAIRQSQLNAIFFIILGYAIDILYKSDPTSIVNLHKRSNAKCLSKM